MSTRITQLLARYIGVLLLAIAGLMVDVDAETQATIGEIALTVSTGLVGFGGVVIDLLIHKAQTGGVMQKAGN